MLYLFWFVSFIFFLWPFCRSIYIIQQDKSEARRLRACGLDSYIPKEELQKALNFERERSLGQDEVNRQQNSEVARNWANRGRKMGVIK